MDYITVKEAAAKWNLAERSIQNYCANEKIPGAKHIGGQWFIPFDAKQPADGRTKAAKVEQPTEIYRFPVFLYTRFYANRSELTPEEACLLKAQILYLEGDFSESIRLSNELLKKKIPAYLKAGVYLTVGVDSLLLGIASEYRNAVARLESITQSEPDHKEDFALLLSVLRYYSDWNPTGILAIRPSNLSPDAVWYYKIYILTVSILSTSNMQTNFLRYMEADCPLLEKEGMIPTAYVLQGILSIAKDTGRTAEEKQACLKKTVRLAVEHNWVSNLARFYNFIPEAITETVLSYGQSYLSILQKAHKLTVNNQALLRKLETRTSYSGLFSPEQTELLLLISYGFTNRDISRCLRMDEAKIKKDINKLMEISNTKNKTELRAYAGKFFDPSSGNS